MAGLSDSSAQDALRVCVTVEVPRGSFLKRDGRGRIAFVSPLPCPFNYGSVPGMAAGDGDWRDAVVLGPRLDRGTQTAVPVRGAIAFVDAGREDLKLICSPYALSAGDRRRVRRFFALYAACKRLLNGLRLRSGRTASQGWCAWPETNPLACKETPP